MSRTPLPKPLVECFSPYGFVVNQAFVGRVTSEGIVGEFRPLQSTGRQGGLMGFTSKEARDLQYAAMIETQSVSPKKDVIAASNTVAGITTKFDDLTGVVAGKVEDLVEQDVARKRMFYVQILVPKDMVVLAPLSLSINDVLTPKTLLRTANELLPTFTGADMTLRNIMPSVFMVDEKTGAPGILYLNCRGGTGEQSCVGKVPALLNSRDNDLVFQYLDAFIGDGVPDSEEWGQAKELYIRLSTEVVPNGYDHFLQLQRTIQVLLATVFAYVVQAINNTRGIRSREQSSVVIAASTLGDLFEGLLDENQNELDDKLRNLQDASVKFNGDNLKQMRSINAQAGRQFAAPVPSAAAAKEVEVDLAARRAKEEAEKEARQQLRLSKEAALAARYAEEAERAAPQHLRLAREPAVPRSNEGVRKALAVLQAQRREAVSARLVAPLTLAPSLVVVSVTSKTDVVPVARTVGATASTAGPVFAVPTDVVVKHAKRGRLVSRSRSRSKSRSRSRSKSRSARRRAVASRRRH
jgi:hypothetical protein